MAASPHTLYTQYSLSVTACKECHAVGERRREQNVEGVQEDHLGLGLGLGGGVGVGVPRAVRKRRDRRTGLREAATPNPREAPTSNSREAPTSNSREVPTLGLSEGGLEV